MGFVLSSFSQRMKAKQVTGAFFPGKGNLTGTLQTHTDMLVKVMPVKVAL